MSHWRGRGLDLRFVSAHLFSWAPRSHLGRSQWRSSTKSSPASTADDEGQGLAEYALILALIAIVAIVALIFLGGQVSTILSTVGDSI